jgi:hypothetical protein
MVEIALGGEMLELDAVVVKERPHEAPRRKPELVAVELDEGDDVSLWRACIPVLFR